MDDNKKFTNHLVKIQPLDVAKDPFKKKARGDQIPFNISTKEGLAKRIRECGFNPADALTLEEIGIVLGGVTRERVRQIEASALKKLRHPKMGKVLKDYVGEDMGFQKVVRLP